MIAMQNYKLTKLGTENIKELTIYLLEVEGDFTPPLFQRILDKSDAKSINDNANKLLSKANVFSFLDNNIITSVIAIYANDFTNYNAYIPILSVNKKYRGLGLASKLLEVSIKCASKNDMKQIYVRTWTDNYIAISLYEKFDFKIKKIDDNGILFIKFIR